MNIWLLELVFLGLIFIAALISLIVSFIKANNKKTVFVIASAVCALLALLLMIGTIASGQKSTVIEIQKPISTSEISATCQLAELVLEKQIASGIKVQTDKQITAFDMNFRNGEFTNLQFSMVSATDTGFYEKIFQVNGAGQLFADTNSMPVDALSYKTVSLDIIRDALKVIEKSTWIDSLGIQDNSLSNLSHGGIVSLDVDMEYNDDTYIIANGELVPVAMAATNSLIGEHQILNMNAGSKFARIYF